jgi:GNAT superfamily N-acetyltransferase
MEIRLRPGTLDDAEHCARICYEAFKDIAERHGFAPDLPSLRVAERMMAMLFQHPDIYRVVAERDGRVVGSNFMDERSPIFGIGPITVDGAEQDSGVGRMLMEDALRRVEERGAPGARLILAGYHNRSLALYTKLGFDVREALVNLQGPPIRWRAPGASVRAARESDFAPCGELCARVHGHTRPGELRAALENGGAMVVEREGRLTGYTTGVCFVGYSVGETNTDLQMLIGAAPEYSGPGFLLPSRNGELLRWCLEHGLRVVQPMTLMSRGFYQEPQGAFLPSILY